MRGLLTSEIQMKTTTIKRFSIVCAYLALIFSAAPAVSACETSNDLIFTRAYTLIQSRQLDEAQQLLNKLTNPNNPRPEVLNNLAAIAQLMDKWEDALILVSQAQAQSPSYASINTNHKLISSSRHFPLQLIEKLPCKEDAQGNMDITQAIDIATKARKARYQSKLTSRPIDHLPEQKSALLKAPLSKDESIEFDSDDLQTAKLVTPPKSFKTSANEANE